jgi:uncharacterized membrane protein (DUF4010 family)
MKRVLIYSIAWFAAVFLLSLAILTYVRQTDQPLAVDEVALSPAAGCPALKVKACDKMDCNRMNLS